jgi:hypothetical protein
LHKNIKGKMRIYVTKLSYSAFSIFSNVREVNLVYPGADPGFQVRGGPLIKIALSGGRREKFWGISCENSRFYAKKADHRISLLPLTSNSKNKTVVSKLHCMSNL